MICIQIRDDGKLCDNKALKSGYCKQHDPDAEKNARREIAEIKKKELVAEQQKKDREEQRAEIFAKEITEAILEIRDLEGLRRVELKVMEGLVKGTIDPKAGSPIVQLLKHQAELVDRTGLEKDNLGEGEREAAIRLAKNLSPIETLRLMSDFANGMKAIIKQVKQEAVPMLTVTEVEVNIDQA